MLVHGKSAAVPIRDSRSSRAQLRVRVASCRGVARAPCLRVLLQMENHPALQSVKVKEEAASEPAAEAAAAAHLAALQSGSGEPAIKQEQLPLPFVAVAAVRHAPGAQAAGAARVEGQNELPLQAEAGTASEDDDSQVTEQQDGHAPARAPRKRKQPARSDDPLEEEESEEESEEEEEGGEDESARPRKRQRTATPKPKRQPASKYVGVRKDKSKWAAKIVHDGKDQRLGAFVDEEDAARAFDVAARRLRGDQAHGGRHPAGRWRLNFPTDEEAAAFDPAAAEAVAKASEAEVALRRAAGQPASPFAGVSWAKKERKWAARIRHGGKQEHLGLFVKEEDAARAFDAAARRLRGDRAHGGRRAEAGYTWRLNFSTEQEAAAFTAEDPAEADAAAKASEALVAQRRAAGQPSSPFPGVSWDKGTRKWAARIRHGGKKQYLGLFDKEEDAAAAAEAAREAAPQPKPSSSAHRGVSRHKATGKWEAAISIGGKQQHLGLFEDEAAAAAAYQRAAAERDA
eukprot:COSAG04_NODE_1550_length_6380_cov_2.250597_8_plen_515_part_00